MKPRLTVSGISAHAVLLLWCLVVLLPIWTLIVNSVKAQKEIYQNPFGLPSQIVWSGYEKVLSGGRFIGYYKNSIIVTSVSLFLIILLGSLAAYGLANWRTRAGQGVYLFFIAGLMFPIRLGTLNIIQIIQSLGLINNIASLIPIYTAMGLPIATFILTSFIRGISSEIQDAARIDGATEFQIYRIIILPLIRPALATVFLFNVIPLWNDLWFPLNLIRAEESRTVTLGVSLLFGQYQTDWTSALSALVVAALPLLGIYVLMSGQFIKGLTAGAVKQ